MKKSFFNGDTIILFNIGNNGNVTCEGQHGIDYAASRLDIFSPIDENGNNIEGEYTDCDGNGVGLTTEQVRTGIGSIDMDGVYNTWYTMKLSNIKPDSNDREAAAIMRNDGDSFVREQALLYWLNGISRYEAELTLEDFGINPDDWFEHNA